MSKPKTKTYPTPTLSLPSNERDFKRMIKHLTTLRRELTECWKNVEDKCATFDQNAKDSSRNLAHYVALRRHDVRKLQADLARHGFSSLGRSESYVMTNITKILKSLNKILQRPLRVPAEGADDLSLDEGRSILKDRTDALLGPEPKHRKVRIMVTLPSEAAENYKLVKSLVRRGMNCARINCAHDGQPQWEQMVKNIERARKETGRECRICFDIAGPKLRTGSLEEGPKVLKLRPLKDVFGNVTQPAQIWLSAFENPDSMPFPASAAIKLPKDFLIRLEPGDKIKFKDARKASRVLIVREIAGNDVRAELDQTAYICPKTEFVHSRSKTTAKAENIPPLEQFIPLQKGDSLILTKAQTPGRPAKLKENGIISEPARVPCTLPEVFDEVRAGEKIWFDDGKIGGVIKSVKSDEILVQIKNTGARIQKLRADKGINLPDSNLHFPSLTAKDLADLEFVVRRADLIGYSFVRSASDVVHLQKKLKELSGNHLGIVLKIETRRAFERLPEILLTAMHSASVGVMIARGDLAIEIGFERLAEAQEEILWMCEAAHIPVIWATQVLEGFSKTGVYSRAEITDAAMSERAECVMLNKGLFVVEAVRALNNILIRMQAHQEKKRSMLRRLHLAENFFKAIEKQSEIRNTNEAGNNGSDRQESA